MTVGDRIRQARKERNMTQAALGEKCGMADSAIRRYESGRGNPTLATLQRIAEALDISYFELMDSRTRKAFDAGIDIVVEFEDQQQRIIKEVLALDGYTYSDQEMGLVKAFSKLNTEGKKAAVERVEELTEIPKYKKNPQE